MGQLQKIESELLGLGFQIIAISPDRPEKLSASVEKQQVTYELVSDDRMEAAKAFGIVFRVGDDMLEKNAKFKDLLEESSGEAHHLLPVPAVYLVDTSGTILFEYINPDYRVRLDPDVLLAAAKAALRAGAKP